MVQGFLVNASAGVRGQTEAAYGIALVGILVNLSAFVTLYKSYQALGYLEFPGSVLEGSGAAISRVPAGE